MTDKKFDNIEWYNPFTWIAFLITYPRIWFTSRHRRKYIETNKSKVETYEWAWEQEHKPKSAPITPPTHLHIDTNKLSKDFIEDFIERHGRHPLSTDKTEEQKQEILAEQKKNIKYHWGGSGVGVWVNDWNEVKSWSANP